MDKPPVKTRFAPSPTGEMHVGNLRTALLNWLYARSQGGEFLLRFEDTDRERSSPAHEAGLLADLAWLGLDPDQPPLRQSERDAIYARYYQALLAADLAYPCFCTADELARSRAAQRAAGRPPRYAGTCAGLDAAARAERHAAGRVPTLRFRVPRGRTVAFVDGIRGPQEFATDAIGDFIIRRADGSPAFFFCNAIDDAEQGVTHVLRGEDHLTNTPRQLLLLEALGLPAPAYAHASTILGDDGAPLSKRNGSRAVAELRTDGMHPLAVLNYLTRLGHGMEDETLLSPSALASGFSLSRLGRSPGQFDAGQLRHWQRLAVLSLQGDALLDWITDAGVTLPDDADQAAAFAAMIQPNVLDHAEVRDWAQIVFEGPAAMDDQSLALCRDAGAAFFACAADAADAGWAAVLEQVRAETGACGKRLFMPLRLALTGRRHGPELPALAAVLGTAETARRLRDAAEAAVFPDVATGTDHAADTQ